jgi:hypothetical protein
MKILANVAITLGHVPKFEYKSKIHNSTSFNIGR